MVHIVVSNANNPEFPVLVTEKMGLFEALEALREKGWKQRTSDKFVLEQFRARILASESASNLPSAV